MKGKTKFLIFCMIFAVFTVKAQQNSLKLPADKAFSISPKTIFSPVTYQFLPIHRIPENFYTKNLSFFCRQEWKLEKVTNLPFRFRLGSVAYTDWLEGKTRTR